MSDSLKKGVLCIIGALVGYFAVSHFSNTGNTGVPIESRLSEIAEELNQKCPIMMDDITRLDYATGGPGKRFTYNYTLLDVDPYSINIDDLRETIVEGLRRNQGMRTFSENDVEIVYIYYSEDEIEIGRLEIPAEEYS